MLVVVPIDADAILPALQEAKDKGVPVILKARGANARGVAVIGDQTTESDLDAMNLGGIRDVLLDDALRTGLVNRGCVQARKFSWERTARQVLAIYKEAVAA